MRAPLLAGLDLSGRHFSLAVARPQEEGRGLLLMAAESVPARGVQRGVLSDPVECAEAVSRLVRQAEKSASGRVSSVWCTFLGNHLKCFNAAASVPVPDPAAGITERVVEEAVQSCRTLSLDYDRQILHAFDRDFSVDGQPGVRNPVGLHGKKLSAELHLVTVPALSVQNLVKILNRSGLEVQGFVLPALAASEAVLAELDKDLGVIVVRIGDYETQAVLFSDGAPRQIACFPWGVERLVDGLSRALHAPRVSVEQLLQEVDSIEESALASERPLPVRGGTVTRTFTQGQVAGLLAARLRELIQRIGKRLTPTPEYYGSSSGLVMVGNLSRLDGFLEMAEKLLNLPVRMGTARGIRLGERVSLKEHHTAAVGLLHAGNKKRTSSSRPWPLPPWLKGVEKVRRLVADYF